MFKQLTVISLLAFCATTLFATTPIQFEELSATTCAFSVETAQPSVSDITLNGAVYQTVSLPEFGLSGDVGAPQLPFYSFQVATGGGVSIEILDTETGKLENIDIVPTEMPPFAAEKIAQNSRFAKDEEIYSSAQYPEAPVRIYEIQKINGVEVATIIVQPVIAHPANRSATFYTKLRVHISFSSPVMQNLSATRVEQLRGSVVNGEALQQPRSRAIADDEDDILIITTPNYAGPVAELATWQKKKGFGVKVVSNSSWTTSSVDAEVKSFYNNATVKPGYLLIVGSYEDVPPEVVPSLFIGYGEDTHVTDHYYTCMDGDSDYAPEMARGRISVKTQAEAQAMIAKIIQYESTPPQQSSFYQNALACGFFQSYTNTTYDENNDPNTADRRFAQTAEEILQYLDSTAGITSERIYCAEDDVTPLYWNNGSYSWGEAVPSHLRRPGFAWDGNYQDIADGINSGSFLIYHYDHGYESGWGDPAFNTGHVNSLLSNGELLPLIYSIDCLVGKFNYTYNGFRNDCFAEVITKKADGGAIGIVAATTLSSSGNNEALLDGMIDATWPGLVLKTPTIPNPTVTEHPPYYRMGDIMNQGFKRMSQTWPWSNKEHYSMYHLFGDPTTPLWTEVPTTVTISAPPTIEEQSTSYEVSGLNVDTGVVTLFSRKLNKVVGMVAIEQSSASVPVDLTGLLAGDTLELTVTGQNYRPLMREITVDPVTALGQNATQSLTPAFALSQSTLVVKNIDAGQQIKGALYDVRGRRIASFDMQASESGVTRIPLTTSSLSQGLYLLKTEVGNKSSLQKMMVR